MRATCARSRVSFAQSIALSLFGLLLLSTSLPSALTAGILPNGATTTPTGQLTTLHTMPLREILDPTGRWLAIIHGGYEEHGIEIASTSDGRIVDQVPLSDAFEGATFSRDGKTVFVAGNGVIYAIAFDTRSGTLGEGHRLAVDGLQPTILAALPQGDLLVASRTKGDKGEVFMLQRVSVDFGTATQSSTKSSGIISAGNVVLSDDGSRAGVEWSIPIGSTPSAIVVSSDASHAYVSNWEANSVTAVDLLRGVAVATIDTAAHPAALVLSKDAARLYVACASTNDVVVIDTSRLAVVSKIDVGLFPGAPIGATPNALALTPDGGTLFVANADENVVVKIQLAGITGSVAGAIPVGWYPTDMVLSSDAEMLFVLDGKGLGMTANPQYRPYWQQQPNPWNAVARANPQILAAPVLNYFGFTEFYVGNVEKGKLERINLRTLDLAASYDTAKRNSQYRPNAPRPDLPPIKHIIYIIKENRTYDQVLGDDLRGNGEPSLAMFGKRITPNIHSLVDHFVLADNYFLEGEVSENGWPFALRGYATDDKQRLWPALYGGQPLPAGLVDAATQSELSESYIWDSARAARLSVRLYGVFPEYISTDVVAVVAPPVGDDDEARFNEWQAEFRGYERGDDLPALEVMGLRGDHTDGTEPYYPTPNAMVAKNDYTLGRVIETLSHSRYWKDTVVFCTEDDAQNGPDHVSAQRSYMVVAGGYVKRTVVDHTHYSLTGILRTIEVIFGLPPMSEYDASATPMTAFFSRAADMRGFVATKPLVSITETNRPNAIDASISMGLKLDRVDENDPALFNRILWDYAMSVGDLRKDARPPRAMAIAPAETLLQPHRTAFATERDNDDR